jgi:hypothetical protein
MAKPPLRLRVGTDASEFGEAAARLCAHNDKRWNDLS